jgi:hypothetical protein
MKFEETTFEETKGTEITGSTRSNGGERRRTEAVTAMVRGRRQI